MNNTTHNPIRSVSLLLLIIDSFLNILYYCNIIKTKEEFINIVIDNGIHL
jgi:hypothetical protein